MRTRTRTRDDDNGPDRGGADGPDGALNQFRSAARRLRQVGGDKINRLLASGVSETFLADNRQQSAQ